MHCETFEQDNYSKLESEQYGGHRVGEVRVALLPPCLTIMVLSYSNCQRSTYSISKRIVRTLAL